MKFNFHLHRLCGGSYGSTNMVEGIPTSGANVVFTASGNTLLSPVGNRIQVVDLLTHSVKTLSCQATSNIKCIALSPKENNQLLVIIDVYGYCMLVNFHLSVVLYRIRFKERNIRCCVFSPCGNYFAFGAGTTVEVWYAPSTSRREYAPFLKYKTFSGLGDEVVSVTWSSDSSIVMGTAKNGTTRFWNMQNSKAVTLSGHKTAVVGAYFETPNKNTTLTTGGVGAELQEQRVRRIYTISRDGAIATHEATYFDEEGTEQQSTNKFIEASNQAVDFFGGGSGGGQAATLTNSTLTTMETTEGDEPKTQAFWLNKARWASTARHYFHQGSDVTTTAYSPDHNLLIVGFESGIFGLYELPSMNNIHTLSLSNQFIRTVAINRTGEWLAFGCPSTQQLLVWEWRSESYVIKQRGHAYGMRCMAYSQDGVIIVTGGEDGSLKLWNTTSGLCYCTLNAHTAPITGCTFANNSVVMSSCLDGTVRAWDLHRYRNFRTYTSPTPCQFSCVAVDPAGEVLVAGTQDDFKIYTWDVQTGKLLDILPGHLGPLSSMSFHPIRGTLASASWDGTVKIWDLYKSENVPESMKHSKDVVCCAFRPDGVQCVTGTTAGILSIWNVDDCRLVCEIDGKLDITRGRQTNTMIKAASKHFTSVCYSADGTCVIAGGNTEFVCIYEVSQKILVKKFVISSNRSEFNPVADVDMATEYGSSVHLPGAKRADDGTRKTGQEVITMQVSFSSTGREWAAVSNEGLLIYTLDDDMVFDPISMTEDITPKQVLSNLFEGKYAVALLISLHLNESTLVKQVIEGTPYDKIVHVVKSVTPDHLDRLIEYTSQFMADSPHVEFYIQWCCEILSNHGAYMEKHRSTFMKSFRLMHKTVHSQHEELKRICDENTYTLDFVQDQSKLSENEAT